MNREGKRPAEESVVTVFRGETTPPALLHRSIDAGRSALEQFERPDSEEAVSCYFNTLLTVAGKDGQDKEGILPLMDDPLALMPFRTVAERFRLIETNTRTVYIPWGGSGPLLERLDAGERTRALFRALGQYGVSVYPQHFEALYQAGALETLEDRSAVLTDPSLYDSDIGLSLAVDSGNALFL